MHYQKQNAHNNLLSQYVDGYWQSTSLLNPYQTSEEIVLPEGYYNLVFNLGAAFERFFDSTNTFETVSSVHLEGLHTKQRKFKHFAGCTIFGVKLKPFSLALWFPFESHEIVNQNIDAFALFGTSVYDLHDQLLHTHCFTKRTLLVEQFLISNIKAEVQPKLSKTIAAITSMQAGVSIDKICATTHTTYKTLERNFKSYVGITPKMTYRLLRFEQSLKFITLQTSNLTNIGYNLAYCDQSHFIKDFKTIARMLPSTYATVKQVDKIPPSDNYSWLLVPLK